MWRRPAGDGWKGSRKPERWNLGCNGRGLWISGRASGGAGGDRRLLSPALIEVVSRHGFGSGRIGLRRLVEAAGEGFLGGLVVFRPAGTHGKRGLGWPPGWAGRIVGFDNGASSPHRPLGADPRSPSARPCRSSGG
jgi:hypothetical protein